MRGKPSTDPPDPPKLDLAPAKAQCSTLRASISDPDRHAKTDRNCEEPTIGMLMTNTTLQERPQAMLENRICMMLLMMMMIDDDGDDDNDDDQRPHRGPQGIAPESQLRGMQHSLCFLRQQSAIKKRLPKAPRLIQICA